MPRAGRRPPRAIRRGAAVAVVRHAATRCGPSRGPRQSCRAACTCGHDERPGDDSCASTFGTAVLPHHTGTHPTCRSPGTRGPTGPGGTARCRSQPGCSPAELSRRPAGTRRCSIGRHASAGRQAARAAGALIPRREGGWQPQRQRQRQAPSTASSAAAAAAQRQHRHSHRRHRLEAFFDPAQRPPSRPSASSGRRQSSWGCWGTRGAPPPARTARRCRTGRPGSQTRPGWGRGEVGLIGGGGWWQRGRGTVCCSWRARGRVSRRLGGGRRAGVALPACGRWMVCLQAAAARAARRGGGQLCRSWRRGEQVAPGSLLAKACEVVVLGGSRWGAQGGRGQSPGNHSRCPGTRKQASKGASRAGQSKQARTEQPSGRGVHARTHAHTLEGRQQAGQRRRRNGRQQPSRLRGGGGGGLTEYPVWSRLHCPLHAAAAEASESLHVSG